MVVVVVVVGFCVSGSLLVELLFGFRRVVVVVVGVANPQLVKPWDVVVGVASLPLVKSWDVVVVLRLPLFD